jgi:D-3-phosphoglycerate dehydrogenase
MARILYADNDYVNVDLETDIVRRHGIELRVAQCRTEAQVIDAAEDCFGILLQYAPITERVVTALPTLGIVSRIGAGYDTIDTAACAKHGVWVANSPDYGIGEVATHALALALAITRNVVAYHRDIAAGQWSFASAGPLRRPREMTLGIVGLGRIGKRMAHIARETFKRVVAFDPYLIDGDFPSYVERAPTLAALAKCADVVSLHTPLTAETRGLIGAKFLAAMPRGGYLVNTARGAIVDVDAVLAALDAGTLAAAALDVLPNEPVPRDSRLLGHPRVVLTPHAAFYSVESERELRRKAVQNLVSWHATGRPDYVVSRGTRMPR